MPAPDPRDSNYFNELPRWDIWFYKMSIFVIVTNTKYIIYMSTVMSLDITLALFLIKQKINKLSYICFSGILTQYWSIGRVLCNMLGVQGAVCIRAEQAYKRASECKRILTPHCDRTIFYI